MTIKSSRPLFKSCIRWPGGKQKAVKYIAPYLPAHVKEYREPMVGGGSFFFHARSVAMAEQYWINDLDPALVSFYSICQNQSDMRQLMHFLENTYEKYGTVDGRRRLHGQLKQHIEATTSHFYRAYAFFVLNRVTFSGTTQSGGFSKMAAMERFTKSSIEALSSLPAALANTRITNYDFGRVIAEPGEDVFLMIDAPYSTAKGLYGNKGDLHPFDHERLARLLKETPHRFLATYDDCPLIRELYSWATIVPLELQYSMVGADQENRRRKGQEILILNYPEPKDKA